MQQNYSFIEQIKTQVFIHRNCHLNCIAMQSLCTTALILYHIQECFLPWILNKPSAGAINIFIVQHRFIAVTSLN